MKETNTSTEQENIQKLSELLKGMQTAMMTTVDENGFIHSRPMATQEIQSNGELWFFTNKTAHKVNEIKKNHQVQLSYVSEEKNKYISITGHCEMVHDDSKVKELWKPIYKAWFPKGIDDPNLALLRIKIEKAEYWDTPSSAVVHLIGLAKSVFTGKPYEDEGSDHKKVDIAG